MKGLDQHFARMDARHAADEDRQDRISMMYEGMRADDEYQDWSDDDLWEHAEKLVADEEEEARVARLCRIRGCPDDF